MSGDPAPDAGTAVPADRPHPWPGGLTPGGLGAAPDGPRRSVGFTISSLGYEIARRFREVLDPLGIEPREFALLRSIAAEEGLSQQAVGGRLRIAPSRMVAFVDALEARGLVERRLNAEDRRTRALHLTDAGRDLLGRAFAIAQGQERNLCGGLSAAEREQLLGLLHRLGERLDVPGGVHTAHSHPALADE
jgi:DNA-binding MarR family transcriptional regulator